VEVPEPKQMKSSRSKEANAERQRKFVESMNEMNSKNYADDGRHWDKKVDFLLIFKEGYRRKHIIKIQIV
jgi:hypothetical protein